MLLRLIAVTLATLPLFSAGFTAQARCVVNVGNIGLVDEGTWSCHAGPLFDPEYGFFHNSVINNTAFVTEVGSGGVSYFELTVDKYMHDNWINNRAFYSLIRYQQTFSTEGPTRMGLINYSLEPGPFGNGGSAAVDQQEWKVGPYGGASSGRSNLYQGDGTLSTAIRARCSVRGEHVR